MLHKREERPAEPEDFSVREAASRLRIGETTIKRAISHRLIRSIRIGRSRRIPASEIERILREGMPVVPAGYATAADCPICLPA